MNAPPGADERALFRAGRDERAPEALRAALLARARETRPADDAAKLAPRGGAPRLSRFPRLLACAALLGAGLAALLFAPKDEPAPAISAEHVDAAPRTLGEPARAANEPAVARGAPTPASATLPESVAPPATPPPAAPRSDGEVSPGASTARERAPARSKESAHPHAAPLTSAPRASTSRATAPLSSAPASSAAPAPPASPAPRASFAEQLDVLARARAALRAGHAASALEILDAHASTLRHNDLEAEGRLLHIEASASAGDGARARREAEAFLRDYPNSPLLERAQSFARPPR